MNLAIEMGPGVIPRAERGSSDTPMLMAIIERAANQPDFNLERIGQLLDLKDRWDRAENKKAFAAAKVAFKQNPPRLEKDKHVKFTNRAGTVTEYDHATHYEVTSKISAALAVHGLEFSWRTIQSENKITVTCILSHIAGHEESVSLYSLADDSGGKNSIQSIASANTYLQRYTLLAVTGMSTVDMLDDDGGAAGGNSIKKPDIALDVWTSLNTAAAEGSVALSDAWRALSDTTRATIVLHYANDWQALKDVAMATKAPA